MGALTRDQYGKLKEAHFRYLVPASTLRIQYPRLSVEEMEAIFLTQNYEEYLAL